MLFVIIVVMTLMMVVVVPKLSLILTESGQDVPFFTKIIIGLSGFLRSAGVFILLGLAGSMIVLWRYLITEKGKNFISLLQLNFPILKDIYKKLFVSRIADNMNTLLSGGVSMVRSLEITADVVGNKIYRDILREAIISIKKGETVSGILRRHKEIPSIVSQMIKVGEETGKIDFMFKTIAKFYTKEVNKVVDNLVSLIEPLMIIVLGLGVGIVVASILIPIYNITTSI